MNIWKAVDNLAVGDLVVTKDGRNTRRIIRFDPRFNPRFRPVVMHDEPHYACDFDRQTDVLVAVEASWVVEPDGWVSPVTPPAPLLDILMEEAA